MFYSLQLSYYQNLYFKELKVAAESNFETIKDFILRMGSKNLIRIFEISRKIQYKKYGINITYDQFVSMFYTTSPDWKYFILHHYGIKTYELYLKAGGLTVDDAEDAKLRELGHRYAELYFTELKFAADNNVDLTEEHALKLEENLVKSCECAKEIHLKKFGEDVTVDQLLDKSYSDFTTEMAESLIRDYGIKTFKLISKCRSLREKRRH